MAPFQRCPARWVYPLLLLVTAGCAPFRPPVDSALRGKASAAQADGAVTGCYAVGCPDVLDLVIPGEPESSGLHAIDVDGRIDLGKLGRLRVEGQAVPDVIRCVAQVAGQPPDQVHVRVAEYRSQRVFLFGQVAGWPRAVGYRGPETVSELLQRVGGITAGAAPSDVYVIRSRVSEGRAPEVFHVDLQAIVVNHDGRTDVRLQPFDQIYVGQNRRSSLEKCVPPCFQPLYELFSGLYRPNAAPPDGSDGPPAVEVNRGGPGLQKPSPAS